MEKRNQRISHLDSTDERAGCSVISNPCRSDVPVSVGFPSRGPARSAVDLPVTAGYRVGAFLLVFGVFLGLGGMSLTIIGWTVSDYFDWTRLLGPILLSVGTLLVFLGICKFRFCSGDDGVRSVGADMLPPLSGSSLLFRGVHHPITFHSATVVQFIPQPHTSTAPDPHSMLPIPLENPPHASDGHYGTLTYLHESRNCRVLEEAREDRVERAHAPPAYEDLFGK